MSSTRDRYEVRDDVAAHEVAAFERLDDVVVDPHGAVVVRASTCEVVVGVRRGGGEVDSEVSRCGVGRGHRCAEPDLGQHREHEAEGCQHCQRLPASFVDR